MGFESVSVDAEASAVTSSGATPDAGDTLSAAVGGVSGGSTATSRVALEERPPVSVTVTVTVYVPGSAYVWLAVAVDCGSSTVPSPKSNVYVAMGQASVSVEPEASAVTSSGAEPEPGVTLSRADGGEFGGAVTVTWVDASDDRPAVSVTVTVTVWVPVSV